MKTKKKKTIEETFTEASKLSKTHKPKSLTPQPKVLPKNIQGKYAKSM